MARQAIVLLVEDDGSVRNALKNALLAENYHVLVAANGAEAMREFCNTPADIALLDLNLGEECGWDVAQQLRQLEPLLTVVVMSGCSQGFTHARAESAAAMLEKPLDLPVLFQTLDRLTAVNSISFQLDHGTGALTERA